MSLFGHSHVRAPGDHGHDHAHGDGHAHSHAHGVVDPSIATSERGLRVVKLSGLILLAISVVELVVVLASRSTALLADMIHNFGDAATVLPLWIAFALARRTPRQGFTFGYGRAEDLAGITVLIVLIANALLAGYEAIERLIHPQPVTHLGIVAITSLVSFAGNEAIALMRIKVGREIGSAALIADGQHARVDGWTALAVLVGAAGVYLGYPLADPIVGLLITVAILGVVYQSARTIMLRALDAVEPEVLHRLEHAAQRVGGVRGVSDVRARWIGHQLYAEAYVSVAPELSVGAGHAIAAAVRHEFMHHVEHVGDAVVHICPEDECGDAHHGDDPAYACTAVDACAGRAASV